MSSQVLAHETKLGKRPRKAGVAVQTDRTAAPAMTKGDSARTATISQRSPSHSMVAASTNAEHPWLSCMSFGGTFSYDVLVFQVDRHCNGALGGSYCQVEYSQHASVAALE